MRLKWKIKMSAIIIIALAIIFLAHSRAEEKTPLNGFGDKLFEVLDQEVEDTKSYQKKQWLKMKNQFKKLFGLDKDWEEMDKEIEEKEDETKEEK